MLFVCNIYIILGENFKKINVGLLINHEYRLLIVKDTILVSCKIFIKRKLQR